MYTCKALREAEYWNLYESNRHQPDNGDEKTWEETQFNRLCKQQAVNVYIYGEYIMQMIPLMNENAVGELLLHLYYKVSEKSLTAEIRLPEGGLWTDDLTFGEDARREDIARFSKKA
jgi:hypothetical protein